MIKTNPRFLAVMSGLVLSLLGAVAVAGGQTQKAANAYVTAPEQALFSEYKGVRLGMPAAEVRAKLGKPTLPGDDQDYYIVSQNETIQIAYDAAQKAKAISIDFIEGVGAPDYKSVVGPDVQINEDGSMHKRVDYDSLGFWVSYSRTAGAVKTVTITIQKSLRS